MKPLFFGQVPPDETVHERAAKWLLRVEASRLNSQEAQALADWISETRENEEAWHQVQGAVALLSENAAHPDLIEMREEALAFRKTPRDRFWLNLAAGLVAAVVLVSGLRFGMPVAEKVLRPSGEDHPALVIADLNNAYYQTVIGERSALTLPDGSVVTLDTNSAIRVSYTATDRGVYLMRGQAVFEVAKHKPVPFNVYAGDRKITAVGTTFDVRLDGPASAPVVRVGLIEGKIRVATASPMTERAAGSDQITMISGEVLTAQPAGPMAVQVGNPEKLASWRGGVLSFEDVTLRDAVAEMNRYTNRPIILGSPAVGNYRVTGVFKSGDPDRFASSVAEVFPVRVAQNGAGSPVLMSN